jgi:hypothetical protein
VWEVKGDRAAGEQHERERGVGGVRAVGAAGDEPDLVVQGLGASLVDLEADRGEDPVAVLADRFAELDERGASRQRARRLSSRSISTVTSSIERPGSKMPRTASLRV